MIVYGSLAAVAVAAAVVQGRSPLAVEPALPFGSWSVLGHVVSLLGGAALALLTIGATRQFVRRWDWARSLHSHLRPAVRHAGGGTLLMLGIASAIGEELFFRGLLTTTFGIVVSSIAFGLLHQTRGRARWVWAGWATVMGVLFAGLFLATGSLLGPLVAHAAINVANLRFLRDTDLDPPKLRRLGGLLADRRA
ncbi:MAG: CPBP family intramembrane metalloprotease [Deltaproteobacteria bacterium]|nr:CPBP family intramembrane metalloprotease [Deltaproteobacteria bacterium]